MTKRATTQTPDAPADSEVGPEPPAPLNFEEFLPFVAPAILPAPSAPSPPVVPALRTARIVALEGRRCTIAWRGTEAGIEAELAPEMDRELALTALAQRDAVLVEQAPNTVPLVVGVVQTRSPRELRLKASTIHIEAEDEILLRAGHSGLRLRQSGEVEIVGSRISAASRGLFRIVGRILRLN
jgi:hypothetical protein